MSRLHRSRTGISNHIDTYVSTRLTATLGAQHIDLLETDDTLVRSVVMVVDTAQAVAIGIGLLLAIRVLGSAARGQAFTADNVRRMTSIGSLALAFLAASVVEVATTLWGPGTTRLGFMVLRGVVRVGHRFVGGVRTRPGVESGRRTRRTRSGNRLMPGDGDISDIVVSLDEVLAERGVTLTQLADAIGITLARPCRPSAACSSASRADLLRYQPGETRAAAPDHRASANRRYRRV